ncbi:tetraacyldisaccharide 4'-kinase [Thiosulfatimonas sediminis]|uniref:Tetraacyldisaccharide 4'-kinase n=1 Tax=Thiosulfatimonas sediminis TaxID=2675054 RepID=A0A6F8PVS8_9GAMM|nr:tetraacyldisaccharide 4'-kinase [Thiosulfatimonas sediminis]BBP46108.1 tetraacyldisaccharide 4'-kinase [Thiosulfatimonas sediminis]
MSWPTFWTKKNWQARLLWPLSKLVAWEALRRLNKFQRTPPARISAAKVIVVGNLVVGGSGKTPLIIWLTKALQQQGLQVGIVSRGYGGQASQWPQWVDAESDARLVGDEPLLLAQTLQVPVAVSPKRAEAIALIENRQACDVIISDDGLQHYAMARDIEIVVVDAQRQFGNQYCLPAGPLREPLGRLSNVDAVVINGGNQLELSQKWRRRFAGELPPRFAMELRPSVFRNLHSPQMTQAVDYFSDSAVSSIAGIGNPQRFFDTLQPYVAEQDTQPLADHHAYTETQLQGFVGDKPLIMTAKDAVKCQAFAQQRQAKNFWALEVETIVAPELMTLILQKLQN